MKLTKLAFSASITLVIFFSTNPAEADHPRACLTHDGSSETELNPDQTDVIYNEFQLQRDGNKYLASTLSDTAKDKDNRSWQCFRYEVINIGINPILDVFWEDAKISSTILGVGSDERISVTFRKQILHDPIVVDSKISFFERTDLRTQAWGDFSKNASNIIASDSFIELAQVSRNEIAPELSEFLQSFGLSADQVLAVPISLATPQKGEYYGKVPFVSTAYRHGKVDLNVFSSAEYNRDGVTFELGVKDTSGAVVGGEVQVSLPSLNAMEVVKVQQNNFDDYKRVLSLYNKMIDNYEEFSSFYHTKKFFVPYIAPNEYIVYLTDIPMIIKNGDTLDCVIVKAYNPIAIDYNLNHCRGLR